MTAHEGPRTGLLRRQHCSSLCSQSEGDEYYGGQTRAENPTKLCPRALVMFATCSWPSLCEQSELQCWRRNRRLCEPVLISAARALPLTFDISILNIPPVREKVTPNRSPILLPLQGVGVYALVPRALPWATNLLGFQPAQGRRQGFFRTISTYLIFLDFERPILQRPYLHLHLINNLSIKHVDHSVGIIGIMQGVGHHHDGCALLV